MGFGHFRLEEEDVLCREHDTAVGGNTCWYGDNSSMARVDNPLCGTLVQT